MGRLKQGIRNVRQHPLLCGAWLLVGAMVFAQFYLADLGDKNWLLLAARRMLQGERLYVDIFEVNPPLIVWLMAIPVSLAKLVHGYDNHMDVLFALVIAVFTMSLCEVILRRSVHYAPDKPSSAPLRLLMALLLIAFVPPLYFADREHLFLLLVTPYLLRWSPSLSAIRFPYGLRIVTGVMAGIGFCIKPHCMIVFAVTQLAVIVMTRSTRILFSVENGLVYSAALLYTVAVWYFTPEYFSELMPVAVATYGANRFSPFSTFFFTPLMTLAGAFMGLRRGIRSTYRQEIQYCLCLVLAGCLYGLANNGWDYTFLPLSTFVLMTVAVLWVDYRLLPPVPLTSFIYSVFYVLGILAGILAYLTISWKLRLYTDVYDSVIGDFLAVAAIMLAFGAFRHLREYLVAFTGLRLEMAKAFCLFVFVAHMTYSLCIAYYIPNTRERLHLGALHMCKNEFNRITSYKSPSFGAISFASDLWPYLVRNVPGTQMVTRYNQFWMLTGLVGFDTNIVISQQNAFFRQRNEAVLTQVTRNLVSDIETRKPQVMFVEPGFSFMFDYMNSHDFFREAWKNYALVETLNACPYLMYVRNPSRP